MKTTLLFSFLLALNCSNGPCFIEDYEENKKFFPTQTPNKESFIALGCRHTDYLELLKHIEEYHFEPPTFHIKLEKRGSAEAKEVDRKGMYRFSIFLGTNTQITEDFKHNIYQKMEDCRNRLFSKNSPKTHREFSQYINFDRLPYLPREYFQMQYDFHYTESKDINKEIQLAYETIKKSLGADQYMYFSISVVVSAYETIDPIILGNLSSILLQPFSYIIITNTKESLQILRYLQKIYQRVHGPEHIILQDHRIMLPISYINILSLSLIDPSNGAINENSYILLLIDLGYFQ